MTHASPPNIDEMLIEVLRKEPADRPAFMKLLCRQDRDLRGELETLVKAHDEAADFLDKPAVSSVPTVVAPAEGRGSQDNRALSFLKLSNFLRNLFGFAKPPHNDGQS